MMINTTTADITAQQLASRRRPDGSPIMYQTWANLLFLHWPVEAAVLAAHLPSGVKIDEWAGKAWITMTPLQISGLRLPLTPAVPYLSEFNELNLRTYVSRDGVPGVWFFSLDANRLLAVAGANTFFSLPYYHADIEVKSPDETTFDFDSARREDGQYFRCRWTNERNYAFAEPGTHEFFLVERYALYTESDGSIYRSRIAHDPWEISTVSGISVETDMLDRFGLADDASKPLSVHAAQTRHVEIWPLEKLD